MKTRSGLAAALLTGTLVVAPTVGTSGHTPASTASAACTKAPAYTGTGTKFGTNLSTPSGTTMTEAVTRQENKYGRLKVVRVFDGAMPPDNAWAKRTPLIGDRPIVTSFRVKPQTILSGSQDANLRKFFSTAPTANPVFYVYYHEPERHIINGEFTMAQYRSAWQRIVNIASSYCKSNLYPTMVLTGWTTDPRSKRNWRDYYPGSDYISVVAWDPYNKAGFAHPDAYHDPSDLYDNVVAASKASGKPFGIAETGSGLVPGDTGKGRAAWLTKVGAYFKTNGAKFVTYFDSDAASDFKLDDTASITAWKGYVSP